MNPNYIKESFGAMLESYDRTPCSDTCYNYGSVNGCDEGCPALLRGECKNIDDAILCCDVDDEEMAEILSLYPKADPVKSADIEK